MNVVPSITQPVRRVQIIVLGLMSGLVTLMAVFTVVLPPANNGDPTVAYVMLAMGAATIVGGFAVPGQIVRSQVSQLDHPADAQNVGQLVGIYTTKTIIGGALFEGGAIGNVIGYHLTGQTLNLACAILGSLCLVGLFPTEVRVRGWLDKLARRQSDAEMMRSVKRGD